MAFIEHDLLPKQKVRKHNMKVKIDLYAYSSELYDELRRIGIIDRIIEVPQLGVVKVPKKLSKSRYDYTVLQLYFHQLIKQELQQKLSLTYNNPVRSGEFHMESSAVLINSNPSIGDILQIITIVYNIGHFYNTFTASRAVVMLAEEDTTCKSAVIDSSPDPRYKRVASALLEEHNYHRLHLLNSLLILERCDQRLDSILLAREILYSYINEAGLPENSKLHYVFELFQRVRDVSYIAYDLQIANTPLTIDLWNEETVLVLFQELLSNYNDRTPAKNLIKSIGKMLDDTVYNENSNAICYYKISRKMVSLICQSNNFTALNYYNDFFIDKESILNKSYRQTRDYSEAGILKLTFTCEEVHVAHRLFFDLEHLNNTRVGFYNRHSGEKTILVSIKNRSEKKATTALRILKTVISHLRTLSTIMCCDTKYLLSVKFFLFYLFSERPVIIKPTIDNSECVLCVRGKNKRVSEIDRLLNHDKGNTDTRHEVEFLKKKLSEDVKNDTSILVPGSVMVYQNTNNGRTLCEFDGMVIYPMRSTHQILLLEAKNTANTPSLGKKCLCKKLDNLSFTYNKNDVIVDNHDAFLFITR